MSCWTKEELENMLEDVVNILDLSQEMLDEHGPHGTPPAELVRLVLDQKDLQIRLLKQGFKTVTACAEVEEEPVKEVCGLCGGSGRFEDATWNKDKSVTLKWIDCPDCKPKPSQPDACKEEVCSECGGKGGSFKPFEQIWKYQRWWDCPKCTTKGVNS